MMELYVLTICPQNINLFLLSPLIGAIECSADLKNYSGPKNMRALGGKCVHLLAFHPLSLSSPFDACKNYRPLEKADWFEATSLSLLGDTFVVVEE